MIQSSYRNANVPGKAELYILNAHLTKQVLTHESLCHNILVFKTPPQSPMMMYFSTQAQIFLTKFITKYME